MSKNLKVLSISSSYIDSKNKDLTFSASTSLLVGKLPSYKRFSNRYISLIKFTIPRLSYKPDSSYLYLYIENYQNTNTILEHFEYYDSRQENYEKQMKMMQANATANASANANIQPKPQEP